MVSTPTLPVVAAHEMYDFVIVGAGSAGSVLADPANRVPVLEAGRCPRTRAAACTSATLPDPSSATAVYLCTE
jgi:choline dehydrogenase-like flavoprotein